MPAVPPVVTISSNAPRRLTAQRAFDLLLFVGITAPRLHGEVSHARDQAWIAVALVFRIRAAGRSKWSECRCVNCH